MTTQMAREIVDALNEKRRKEWREAGKQAYKSCASMMRGNSHHKDYDTHEKREAIHEANSRGEGEYAWNFNDNGRERLRTRCGYTETAIDEAKALWIEGYKASRAWYAREDAKQQAVLDRFKPIFDEASRIAHAVDVSDIRDGFPCGSVHLYLQKYAEREDLYKAIGHFNRDGSDMYKYKLPIDMPTYGQCIAFDERICRVVNEYLRSKGIFAHTHSWVD